MKTAPLQKSGSELTALLALLGSALFRVTSPLAQPTEVETFSIPRSIELAQPSYPPSQARIGGEGMVYINFMVDTEGKPFDPVIVDSTGDNDFHERALEALLESRFEPAQLNGTPIVGSTTLTVYFMLEGADQGASQDFASAYRFFQRNMEQGDAEGIETAMSRLEDRGGRNHYENAFLNLARSTYAQQNGSEREQIRYLRRALSLSDTSDDRVHLDPDLVQNLRRALLPLQIRNNLFAEAIATYELIEESGDSEGTEMFAQAIEAVRTVASDDTEYYVPIDLGASGSSTMRLHKHSFALVGGQGDLNEVILRCERQYLAFAIERDVSYDVPPAYGDCSIEIIGDTGAEFFLMQH